jgi:ubiquinone/menaquinone biosynthesis C-methylase UbiE
MTIHSSLVRQFGKPSGLLGVLAGLIMQVRPSNRVRNLRTLELLDIRSGDRVLELGFGPGLAVKRASELATSGKVVGIDHSALMLREARRRNAAEIRTGRVELLLGSADALPRFEERFDKVLAVNVFMFWEDPVSLLAGLRGVMKSGAVIALTLQPRRSGATVEDTRAAAERMATALRDAGYEAIRKEMMEMAPVAAVCVLGRTPSSA